MNLASKINKSSLARLLTLNCKKKKREKRLYVLSVWKEGLFLHESLNVSEQPRSYTAQVASGKNVLHVGFPCFVNTGVMGL